MDLPYLKELLEASYQHTLPPAISGATARIATERAWVEELLRQGNGNSIYGFNTELGHRDFVTVDPKAGPSFQQAIFESHNMRPSHARGVYPQHAASLIGYVKLFQLSHGGSGISPQTYERVIQRVTDPTFLPRIPAGQSYSSGDVLPATHWANAVFDLDGPSPFILRSGEMIALINGNFVHTALAAENYRELMALTEYVVVSGAYAGRLCELARINYVRELPSEKKAAQKVLAYLARTADGQKSLSTSPQRAVSVRAIPDVIVEFCSAHHALGVEIETLIPAQSANPLFDLEHKEVFSSPSFLAIGLALAQNKMIETLLMVLRAAVARLSFILSGRVAGIPEDGLDPSAEAGLGLIQVPKELTAVVESAYQTYGRRGFASGGATSYGVEDLWTHGEALSRDIHQLTGIVQDVLRREVAVYEVVSRRCVPSRSMRLCPESSSKPLGMVAELHCVEDILRGLKSLTGECFED